MNWDDFFYSDPFNKCFVSDMTIQKTSVQTMKKGTFCPVYNVISSNKLLHVLPLTHLLLKKTKKQNQDWVFYKIKWKTIVLNISFELGQGDSGVKPSKCVGFNFYQQIYAKYSTH